MPNTPSDRPLPCILQLPAQIQPSSQEDTRPNNDHQQQSKALSTSSEAKEPLVKGEVRPFVGIRQYTNAFSPELANSGFIKRSRLIFDALHLKLIQDYYG